jgi:predicted SAM-dependent methyltransferase
MLLTVLTPDGEVRVSVPDQEYSQSDLHREVTSAVTRAGFGPEIYDWWNTL